MAISTSGMEFWTKLVVSLIIWYVVINYLWAVVKPWTVYVWKRRPPSQYYCTRCGLVHTQAEIYRLSEEPLTCPGACNGDVVREGEERRNDYF